MIGASVRSERPCFLLDELATIGICFAFEHSGAELLVFFEKPEGGIPDEVSGFCSGKRGELGEA